MTPLAEFDARLAATLAELRGAGLLRQMRLPHGIDLVSNDYLGFAEHPYIRACMRDALANIPAGSGGSRLLRGHHEIFDQLEARLASFCGSEAALLFGSGYAANTGLLQAIVSPADLVVSDELNHASLIDGIRLAKARTVIYPHQDISAIEAALAGPRTGRAVVVTESVFSMDGDLSPLSEIVSVAERHGAVVVVDEAHATGLYGARGSGRVEALGLRDHVLATIHTGGKALGSGGAWIAGSRTLCDVLINRARSFVFSTAPMPVLAVALNAGLDLLDREPARRMDVHRKVALVRQKLAEGGIQAGGDSPIVPIVAGSNDAALALQAGLCAAGFDVRAVRPPTVAPGTARLRATVHYPVSDADLQRFAATLSQLMGSDPRNQGVRPHRTVLNGFPEPSMISIPKGSDPVRQIVRQWDAQHVWHPFTQMQEYLASEPLVVVSAEGRYLIDDRGRRLFDGTSALWCNLFGHRVPEIDAAIIEQLGRFAHTTLLGTTHPAAAELARTLVGVAPKGLNHVFFSDNGATAVESALKIAFQYRLLTQGKDAAAHAVYLSLDNAYHGDTLGAAAVGGVELFHDVFKPILLPALKTPSPYCYRCPLGKTPKDCSIDCANELETALAGAEGRVCAVILEPGVQAAAGMLVLPEGFLARAAAACRKHGALLILDEVATGFGRTGSLFACQREGVTPDIMCVAKGLTGGYLPVAATLATDEIYNTFLGRYDEYRHFFHGHTYTGNALGCAAALATLGLLADGAVVKAVEGKAVALRAALAPLATHKNVGDVRQLGLMCGIELVADRATKTLFPPGDRNAYHICLSLRDRGIFLRPLGDVIVVMPPLTSTDAELAHLGASVHAAIAERLGA